MKNRLRSFLLASLFLAGFSTQTNATPETYTLDPNHSYVMWHINHFGFSNPSGKWYVNGSLIIDEKNPQNSKVSVTIPVAKMDTGLPALDDHLRSKAFFETDRYPTATFVSERVVLLNKHSAKVKGILTLHGVSKPVTLDVTLNKMGVNPISDKETAGFSAKAMVKRSDFGMTSFLPGLGDDVVLHIEVEAAR